MKIIIATDGSDFSRHAIEKVCEMIIGNDYSLEIISVYDEVSYFEQVAFSTTEPYANIFEYVDKREKIGRKQAAENIKKAEQIIYEKMGNFSPNLETKIVKGSPEKEILEEAEKWKADLIVLGSHGYGFWKRAYLGSTSDKVVRYAPCSVLIVREKAND